MPDFQHPKEGFRFAFKGMKTNAMPNHLPPNKFPYTQNIRAVLDTSMQTRPGMAMRIATAGVAITDIATYAGLSTDNLPSVLARDSSDQIFTLIPNNAPNGLLVDTMLSGDLGATMIPFRPNQSPTPYIYVANGAEYKKYSIPNPTTGAAQVLKAGIAEPQVPPEAVMLLLFAPTGIGVNPGWVQGGTATAAVNGTRLTSLVAGAIQDPTPGSLIWSVIVTGGTSSFQKLMQVSIGGISVKVLDIFPPNPNPIAISSIFYFSGTTGRCIIKPANIGAGPGNELYSIYLNDLLATLRRGSIITIGIESVLVLSVTVGPDENIAIETSTTLPHTAAETFVSQPVIQVRRDTQILPLEVITAADVTYQVSAGIGTQTAPSSPALFDSAAGTFQVADYITMGIFVDTPANLTEMKIMFDVGDGSFTQNFYYFAVRPSDLTPAVTNAATQLSAAQIAAQHGSIDSSNAALQTRFRLSRTLDGDVIDRGDRNIDHTGLPTAKGTTQAAPGASQWTQIVIPIGALTRVGSDTTKTLRTLNKVQILWNASGVINVATGSLDVFGGGQPDVGDVGIPYFYRVRPRSSITGAKGNPSPATRYGVNPRRMGVYLTLPSAAYDNQINTWDIFRFGGSVTSWRLVGSVSSTAANFLDNFSDSAIQAGEELEFDNFEPWPSLDVPLNATVISISGTTALVNVPQPNNVLRMLPGNLVQLTGGSIYTLWTRPTLVSGTTYLFQFKETIGQVALPTQLFIYEPEIANQPLPYMWGPDAAGTMFACGDPLRPGTVYFSKNYAPDSAPDANNLEITQPSEPLLGGEIMDGLCFVASTERWWALIPTPDNPAQAYSIRQEPLSRGLAAPYAHCNEGTNIYWWAKDGIWSSSAGSLTDEDLYNIFPHEGVPGQPVTYNANTVFPPDYSRAGTFRLAYSNGFLYATYQDSTGTYRCLVLDIRLMAWSVDVYVPTVSVFHHPEQQAGTVLSAGPGTPPQPSGALYDETLMGTSTGLIVAQADNSNDRSGPTGSIQTPIVGIVISQEYDGGDTRSPVQWGDIFIDSTPTAIAGVDITPLSLGAPVAQVATLLSSAVRIRQPVSVGGIVVSDNMALQLAWTDDFTKQQGPTQLHEWMPSFVLQPARTIAWATFGTAFGITGYMHIRQIAIAWVSTAPITLTIASVDGQSPQAIIIPSSNGLYMKQMFPLTANKGMLYEFQAVSAQTFQLFMEDSDLFVGSWSRTGAYAIQHNLGGSVNAPGVI